MASSGLHSQAGKEAHSSWVYQSALSRAGMGRRSCKAPPLSCYPKPTAAKISERMETRITTAGMMIMAVPSTFTVAR